MNSLSLQVLLSISIGLIGQASAMQQPNAKYATGDTPATTMTVNDMTDNMTDNSTNDNENNADNTLESELVGTYGMPHSTPMQTRSLKSRAQESNPEEVEEAYGATSIAALPDLEEQEEQEEQDFEEDFDGSYGMLESPKAPLGAYASAPDNVTTEDTTQGIAQDTTQASNKTAEQTEENGTMAQAQENTLK